MTTALCVVIAHENSLAAVWAVNTGGVLDAKESRLSGAWTLPLSELGDLHVWGDERLTICQPPETRLDQFVHFQLRMTSLENIVGKIQSEIQHLTDIFAREMAQRPKSAKLLPPRWPSLLIADATNSLRQSRTTADPVDVALSTAKQVAKLAEAWFVIEQERLSRPFLHLDTPEARPMPA